MIFHAIVRIKEVTTLLEQKFSMKKENNFISMQLRVINNMIRFVIEHWTPEVNAIITDITRFDDF